MNTLSRRYKVEASLALKILCFLLMICLILTSVTTAVRLEENVKVNIRDTQQFASPTLAPSSFGEEYVDLTIEGLSSSVHVARAPKVPQWTKEIELPFGATDIDVSFSIDSPITTIPLDDDMYVSPAPVPVPLTLEEEPSGIFFKLLKVLSKIFRSSSTNTQQDLSLIDDTIYSSDSFYPNQWFSYDIWVGRNDQGDMATFVVARITPCHYSPGQQLLRYITSSSLEIQYQSPSLPAEGRGSNFYDLLILSANDYVDELAPLVEHKEQMGFKTKLVSMNEIYDETYFDIPSWSHDDQETVKYFIYQAWTEWDVRYVLVVGGFRTFLGFNVPDQQFPIRYSHLDDGEEPGYACDQYYSCFLKKVGNNYLFDDWDTDSEGGDGIFGENSDTYDPYPDIYFGRLACRNAREVNTMVEKIITYETETYGSDWFNKILTITGDGFQDLGYTTDNNVTWDTSALPEGAYTIYAQSCLTDNPSFTGPIDNVTVWVDHTADSEITYHEWDHLLVEKVDENQERLYPGKPVAHIVVPTDGNILGTTGIHYNPEESYCSDMTGWGRVDYEDNVLEIKIKSYDPSPKDDLNNFGSRTNASVWVEDSNGNIVFGPTTIGSEFFYEGEMECQKALDYMPEEFEQIKLWSSNGNWAGMWDVIDTMSEGQGFVYFAGHGNPMSWGDHLPAIPGGRGNGMINGLKCFNLDFGLARYETEKGDPMFPMDKLTNGNKLPVLLVGGCHNSAIDASFLRLFLDPEEVLFTVLHGLWVPETWAWWLERVSRGGAIATIGCAGLGYGYLGEACVTEGLGGWINPEFFRVYAEDGRDILGETFTQTITNYVEQIGWLTQADRKTFEEWMFLGDPTLKIGGYPSTGNPENPPRSISVNIGEISTDGSVITTQITNTGDDISSFVWEIALESDSPLGEYFGGSPLLLWLFKGRILRGGYFTDVVPGLAAGERIEIQSGPFFGLGHVLVNVSIYVDDALIRNASEDGFVLLKYIGLHHEEE